MHSIEILAILTIATATLTTGLNAQLGSSNGEENGSAAKRRVNVTSITSKQAKLPCFVQSGRKFIWMHANRDEILSIDGNMITSDRRFSVEQTGRCRNRDGGSGGGGAGGGEETRRRAIATDPFSIVIMSGMNQTMEGDEHLFLMTSGGGGGGGGDEGEQPTSGCLVYLVINSVGLYDEGLYVCQIDTMTSTWVHLNILG